MHAALVKCEPGDQCEWNVDRKGAHPRTLRRPEGGGGGERDEQCRELDASRIEDRNDRNRPKVVNDREGQKEGAQGQRELPSEEGEDGECEGDVGRHRHAPATEGAPVSRHVEGDVEQRGGDHPAKRGGDRHNGTGWLGERTVLELVLQLKADHKEEEGEQAVGNPCPHRQIKVQFRGSYTELADTFICTGERRVCEQHPRSCRDEDQRATKRLVLEEVGNTAPLNVCARRFRLSGLGP